MLTQKKLIISALILIFSLNFSNLYSSNKTELVTDNNTNDNSICKTDILSKSALIGIPAINMALLSSSMVNFLKTSHKALTTNKTKLTTKQAKFAAKIICPLILNISLASGLISKFIHRNYNNYKKNNTAEHKQKENLTALIVGTATGAALTGLLAYYLLNNTASSL